MFQRELCVRHCWLWIATSLVALSSCSFDDRPDASSMALPAQGGPWVSPPAMAGSGGPLLVMPPPMQPMAGAGVQPITGSAGASGVDAGAVPADHDAAAPADMPMHAYQMCVDPEPVAAADATITKPYELWTSSAGEVDLLLPKSVIDWMDQRLFREGHDGWHIVRKCFGGGFNFPGLSNNDLCSRTELKPKEQECEGPSDGIQFLLVHRHMLQTLRQAFPHHLDMFTSFPKFPFNAQDVPMEWRDRWGSGWSQQIIQTATTLEDIEHHLDMFPSEGDLGTFIQCGGMGATSPMSSVHGALHFKWIVNGSPVLLGNQSTNTANYMFWKLHGWIDDVWERYRVAKGMKADDPELVQALTDQCMEMHEEGLALGPQMGQTIVELPKEAGFFHESVRPILEKNCSGCHSGNSPEGGMVLGGNVSSADIVTNLVGKQTVRGGQFKRVVAGDPDHSWLYLKPSGKAAMAGCTGTCNTQVMPPTGMVTISDTDLATIKKWIMDGAAAPTKP